MTRNCLCSWSGGKDSCFALMQAIQTGYAPKVLLNVLNEDGKISRSHGIPSGILQMQADAANIPIHLISSSWQEYEKHFTYALSELKEKYDWLKRLAFFGLTEEAANLNKFFPVKAFKNEEIDCFIPLSKENIDIGHKALDCYVTYTEVIEGTKIREMLLEKAPHEFFMESFNPPVQDLLEGL